MCSHTLTAFSHHHILVFVISSNLFCVERTFTVQIILMFPIAGSAKKRKNVTGVIDLLSQMFRWFRKINKNVGAYFLPRHFSNHFSIRLMNVRRVTADVGQCWEGMYLLTHRFRICPQVWFMVYPPQIQLSFKIKCTKTDWCIFDFSQNMTGLGQIMIKGQT